MWLTFCLSRLIYLTKKLKSHGRDMWAEKSPQLIAYNFWMDRVFFYFYKVIWKAYKIADPTIVFFRGVSRLRAIGILFWLFSESTHRFYSFCISCKMTSRSFIEVQHELQGMFSNSGSELESQRNWFGVSAHFFLIFVSFVIIIKYFCLHFEQFLAFFTAVTCIQRSFTSTIVCKLFRYLKILKCQLLVEAVVVVTTGSSL